MKKLYELLDCNEYVFLGGLFIAEEENVKKLIGEIMEINKCENCKYARKAINKKYVGCVKFWKEQMEEDYDYILDKYEINKLTTGYVYLKRKVDCEKSETIDSNLLTDNVITFPKSHCCKFYKSY